MFIRTLVVLSYMPLYGNLLISHKPITMFTCQPPQSGSGLFDGMSTCYPLPAQNDLPSCAGTRAAYWIMIQQ